MLAPTTSTTFLAAVEFFGQKAELHDIVVVGLLVVLEGVLSIDNALVLGLLAKRLPKRLQGRALTYGLVGALIFRMAAIGLATFLLQFTLAKLIGGGYLVWVALKHFFMDGEDEEAASAAADEEAELSHTRTEQQISAMSRFFWKTVII